MLIWKNIRYNNQPPGRGVEEGHVLPVRPKSDDKKHKQKKKKGVGEHVLLPITSPAPSMRGGEGRTKVEEGSLDALPAGHGSQEGLLDDRL